jgi:DNA-binding MarR family transcriptional regulator/GNAT superfamily N-acetyltransferase
VPQPELQEHIAAIRSFNRLYARQIGGVGQGLSHGHFSLTQVRVLYELGHRESVTAAQLGRELGLDAGYLSRILGRFAKCRLITKTASEGDGRRSLLALTDKGRETFATLNARADEEIGAMLAALAATGRRQLIEAMRTIERIFGAQPVDATPYILRHHQPGDMGWVVHRHGVLYAQEYGWDERFEALIAGFVAEFVRHHDPKRERCWIAEREGEIVGSAFLVQQSKRVAKIRLLLVEPDARGLGIGSRLMAECAGLARRIGYRKMTLWTNDVLRSGRHIYERAGFRLTREEQHHRFGQDLVGQTWEQELSGPIGAADGTKL